MQEDNYIEGIYNYCDGWCEKCAHTSRCSLFAEEFKEKKQLFNLDEDENSEFWTKLNQLFSQTYDSLLDLAQEHDIDVSDIEKMEIKMPDSDEDEDDDDVGIYEDDDDDDEDDDGFDDFYEHDSPVLEAEHHLFSSKEIDRISKENDLSYMDEVSRKIILTSVLVKLTDHYRLLTEDWFNSSDDLMNKREDNFNNLLDMDIPGVDPERMILPINDAVDVISWYIYMIQERIKKALFDKMKSSKGDENDFHGSAKVALLGIDRSIVSWSSLYEQFEETEDKILTILLVLSELRTKLEEEFPESRAFIREGLD